MILVAEDDLAISKAVTLLLEHAGYAVDPVLEGLDILGRMEKTLPDLLLLDVYMSGADGREICLQLKRNKMMKHIPIIMMTANNDVKKMAKEARADDFIAKPFDMFDLLRKIEKYVF